MFSLTLSYKFLYGCSISRKPESRTDGQTDRQTGGRSATVQQ